MAEPKPEQDHEPKAVRSWTQTLGLHHFWHPIRKYSFSFIGIHYMYIIGMAILLSVVLYADRSGNSLRYIDALFFAAGACTQAGLNPVNVNDLYLYQQVCIYIVAFVTSIVTINTSVVVFRIYWIRKHIADIEANSKLQSRMRRTATMVRAESEKLNDMAKRSLFEWLPGTGRARKKMIHRVNTLNKQQLPQDIEHGIDKIGESSASSPLRDGTTTATEPAGLAPPQDRDIRFGELPSPRNPEDLRNPEEMMRSLQMMQNSRRASSMDMSDEPALIIKSPRDVAREYARRSRRKILRRKLRKRRGSKADSIDDSGNNDNSALITGDENDDDDDDDDADGNNRDDSEEENNNKDDDGDDADDENDDDEPVVPPKRTFPYGPVMVDRRASEGQFKNDQQLSPSEQPASSTGLTFAERDGPHKRFLSNTRDSDDEEEPSGPAGGLRQRKLHRRPRQFSRSFSVDRMLGRTKTNGSQSRGMITNYLSWEPTVGRNSAFVGLSADQKEELGGAEYRALKLLVKVLLIYNLSMPILGWVLLLPWTFSVHDTLKDIFIAAGFNPAWWCFFTVNSAFTDLGFTLTPDSMNSFQHQVYVLLVLGFFIIAGNTGFPCLLRFILWVMFKITPAYGRMHESLGFLLDHPRRCFTLLFPSSATWWLLVVLVILNGIDWLFFMVLDLGSKDPVSDIPVGFRVICGLFQAIATRTAGFGVIPLSDLHPAVQVSYLIMMYISVFPVAISMRRTNVYEEQSLGVYYDEDDINEAEKDDFHPSYVQVHLRKQLSFDLWFIFLGLFVLCISESGKIRDGSISIFDILFEIVSAYGTVGLSMGFPNYDPSLSGKFSVIGKLVIIAMMIRGRHRGLPYALDRAIMLKGEEIQKNDELQQNRAIHKRVLSSSFPMESVPSRASSTGLQREQTQDNFREQIRHDLGYGRNFSRWDSQAVSVA